jgi:hypothetical protein
MLGRSVLPRAMPDVIGQIRPAPHSIASQTPPDLVPFGVFDGYDSSLVPPRFRPTRKTDIEDASPSERRCLWTPPHL